jgi:hypothetical protein
MGDRQACMHMHMCMRVKSPARLPCQFPLHGGLVFNSRDSFEQEYS